VDAGVGGQLQGISLDSFLQMVQMEKTTCTLKVVSRRREGFLYILNGDLISAETQGLENLEAACAIISWDDAVIEIENSCAKTENEINQPLMHVLMEGLKLKDERAAEEPDDDGQEATVPSDAQPADGPDEQTGEEEPVEVGTPSGRDVTKGGDEFELHVKPKKESGLPKVPMILGIVLVAAVAGYFALSSTPTQSREQVYQSTLAEVELTDDLNQQVRMLQEFIDSAEAESEWTAAASRKIDELKTMRENTAYLEVFSQAERLVASQAFMAAVDLYAKHLKRFPNSPNGGEIKAEMNRLVSLSEKTDYAAVTAAAAGDITRLQTYRNYLAHHPQGDHAEEVKALIDAMEGEYFSYTKKQIAKSAMQEDWENASRLVKDYADIYPNGDRTQKMKQYLPLFEKNRLEYADYKKIMDRAHAAGTDYAKAHKILADHLKAYPGTHLAKKIQEQIVRYQKMDEETKLNNRIAELEARLLKSKGRFNTNGDGTFTDKRTGLMWATLDSKSVLDSCLNYESATAYIQALNTGGHGDWRLPTPGELKTLYKVEPYFPAATSSWLWTSKILKKYVGEWLIDVTIVTADNKPESKDKVKDSRYCGNVRAIRRP